jgi:hypothetical protein
MNATALERSAPADVLRFLATGLPQVVTDDTPTQVARANAGPRPSPILRGAAYIAALDGDPWRPRS